MRIRVRRKKYHGKIKETSIRLYKDHVNIAYVSLIDDDTFIENLEVRESYQGNGFAKLLMLEVIRRYGHHDLWLKAEPFKNGLNLDELKHFYNKLGFIAEYDDYMSRKMS